ncbi:MAG: enoyl-CoA hydratase/isomerase family protein [Phenylobacterium sp.]|uniref:enoyl-CoA hydratase/isomerase family protein n=1 Tax=Phenylobacterium sp. TaxID=1871053 RepID=UPI00391CA902
MSEGDFVRLTRQGSLAEIVLSNPERRNVVNLAFARQLRACASSCASDPAIRAVLMRAEGASFCVGGDLAEFHALGPARQDYLSEIATEFHAAQALLMTMRPPLVVAVQGSAAGAGLGLALVGDIVLAAESASFTVAYTAVGLSADGGSTYLLPRLVGLRRAQELMLTNRRLTSAEALDWGLITALAPDDQLRPEAEQMVLRLSAGPAAAQASIKALLAETHQHSFFEQTDLETREVVRNAGRADAAEGISAFVGKRQPRFRGD